MNRRDALQQLGAFALLTSPIGLALGHPQGNVQGKFQDLKFDAPPMSPDAAGKIEVLGFFHYGCSHCREFEPLLEQWTGRLPNDVVFAQVPVVWDKKLESSARLYYTLLTTKRHDLHKAVFAATQDQRLRFEDPKVVRNWAQTNKLDVPAFMSVFESMGVDTQAKRAQQSSTRYKISSVPTMVVGGRFLTSPALAGNSYEATLKIVDNLIERVRKG
jgi:thiol:disulfide interchange protein DsbA